MAEPWLLVPPGVLEGGSRVELEGEEARHASGSLRLRSGNRVVLADGRGRTARAVLSCVTRRRVEADVESVDIEPEPIGAGVTLALGVLHSQAMDWAVQKAVEVGVRRFVPLLAQRGQLSQKAIRGRIDHWRRVAAQALKQCRRCWAMEVSDPKRLATLVEERDDTGGLIADREGVVLRELPGPVPGLLVVGPEGGFSSAEEQTVTEAGWTRVRFGPHMLRAETAAIVGAAMLVQLDETR